jgi:IclR family KDG regulon transcriptional repressor
MPSGFKRVPAVDKCFAILELLSATPHHLGVSDISSRLELNKSTVFNIIHTLTDLGVLEKRIDGKFQFGHQLYSLAIAAGNGSEVIQIVHPYLEKINAKTKLSAFLGIRSDTQAIIVDKVDTANDIKISSEVGMRLPLLAGAGGKALLSQLSDPEIDAILRENELQKFTPRSCTNKAAYKKTVLKVRAEGIAYDMEEYIEGIIALAVPLNTQRSSLQAAIWVVGLKRQARQVSFAEATDFLKVVTHEINHRFLLNAGPTPASDA